MKYWLMHAGDYGEARDVFLTDGIIAMDWRVGDLRLLPTDKKLFMQTYSEWSRKGYPEDDNPRSIRTQARYFSQSPRPHPMNLYHRTMSYRDLAAVDQLVQTDEEKSRIRQIINDLAKATFRGNLTVYWWLPLDSVSFAGIDEVAASEEEKLYVNALACECRHRDESPLH